MQRPTYKRALRVYTYFASSNGSTDLDFKPAFAQALAQAFLYAAAGRFVLKTRCWTNVRYSHPRAAFVLPPRSISPSSASNTGRGSKYRSVREGRIGHVRRMYWRGENDLGGKSVRGARAAVGGLRRLHQPQRGPFRECPSQRRTQGEDREQASAVSRGLAVRNLRKKCSGSSTFPQRSVPTFGATRRLGFQATSILSTPNLRLTHTLIRGTQVYRPIGAYSSDCRRIALDSRVRWFDASSRPIVRPAIT